MVMAIADGICTGNIRSRNASLAMRCSSAERALAPAIASTMSA